MIWFGSDYHLNHKNILGFEAIKARGLRPYTTVEEMDADMIATTNRYVKQDDLFIFDGDFIMSPDRDDQGYLDRVRGYIDRFTCKNILWVGGNHDLLFIKRHGEYVKYIPLWNIFRWRRQCLNCDTIYHRSRKDCPKCKCADYEPVEGIYPMGLELRITPKLCDQWKVPERFVGMHIFCTHYSMRVWNKSHHNKKTIEKTGLPKAVNFYGHSHGELPGIFCSYDVGWDVFGRPVSLTEMIEEVLPKHHATTEGKTYFGHHESSDKKNS